MTGYDEFTHALGEDGLRCDAWSETLGYTCQRQLGHALLGEHHWARQHAAVARDGSTVYWSDVDEQPVT